MKIAPSVKLILWPQPLQDGSHDIRLRVSHSRLSKYVSTGVSLLPHQWDKESCRAFPAKSFKDQNQLLTSIEARAQAVAREFGLNNTKFSFSEFLKKVFANYENSNDSANVVSFLNHQADIFSKNLKTSSANIRKNVAKNIGDFGGVKTFHQITPDFLKNYEVFLRKNNCADKTISVHFAVIKNACREAVRSGIMPSDFRPFDQFRTKLNMKTTKRAITLDEFYKIESYPLKAKSREEFYRDMFILSFLLRGINLNDMARMTKENIIDSRLVYRRTKTRAIYNIQITSKASEIIARHRAIEGEHILPILKPHHKTDIQIKQRLSNLTNKINICLRKIAEGCGISQGQKALSFYTARHTYATALLRAGVNHATIQEAMGHSSITTTEIYLKDIGDSAVDAADQLIFK